MLVVGLLVAGGFVCYRIHRANHKPSKPALRFDEFYVKRGISEVEEYLSKF